MKRRVTHDDEDVCGLADLVEHANRITCDDRRLRMDVMSVARAADVRRSNRQRAPADVES